MSDDVPEARQDALAHEEERHDKQADVSHEFDHGAEYGREAGVTQLFFCPVSGAAPGPPRRPAARPDERDRGAPDTLCAPPCGDVVPVDHALIDRAGNIGEDGAARGDQ